MLHSDLIPFSYGCFVEDFYCIEFVFSFVLGKKNLIGQSTHHAIGYYTLITNNNYLFHYL